MCDLVINDVMEEMSEEIQRLRKELSIERQLNVKLTEEVNKLRDQMTDSRGDRSTMGSTVGTHVTGDSVGNKLMVRFKCLAEECDHRFMSKTSLIEHMINGHQMEDIYECEECDDLCLSEEALIGHKHRAHTSATDVSTRETSDAVNDVSANESIGDESIAREGDIQTTSGIEIIDSEDTDSNGSADSVFNVVIDSDETEVDTEDTGDHYTCPKDGCDEQFPTTDALIRHINIRAHQSDVSGFRRRTAGHHSGHKRVFKCDFIGCGKTFKHLSQLKPHQLIHSADKPYKCPIDGCDYRCVQRYSFTAHVNRHLGVRPYVCAVQTCRKAYVNKSQLKQHQLVHSNERPFRCPHCHKRFKRRSTLDTHRVCVHNKSGH